MKREKYFFVVLWMLLFPVVVRAQAIDNTLSFKQIDNRSYLRLNYENDFFSATDKYYTQGVSVEVAGKWVKGFPLTRLLVHPHWSAITYGIGAEHDAYTPTDIGSSDILTGDRPFAACLFLKTFSIAADTIHRQRLSTTISTGIIGPAALGGEMQMAIHRALDNILPRGWNNQVQNDVILNYQVDYERQLLGLGRYFSVDADAVGRAGTLSDKAGIGTTIMAGYFNSPFGITVIKGRNFRLYGYEHAEVDAVGYDATLQGGVFNNSSPYVIAPGNIQRLVLQNRFGFVMVIRKVYLEYFQSYISREFSTGDFHVWGGVQLAVGL